MLPAMVMPSFLNSTLCISIFPGAVAPDWAKLAMGRRDAAATADPVISSLRLLMLPAALAGCSSFMVAVAFICIAPG